MVQVGPKDTFTVVFCKLCAFFTVLSLIVIFCLYLSGHQIEAIDNFDKRTFAVGRYKLFVQHSIILCPLVLYSVSYSCVKISSKINELLVDHINSEQYNQAKQLYIF